MDINSLLSPQETPSRSSNPPPSQINPAQSNPPASPLRRARPGSGKRTGSGLSNEITVHSPPHEAPRSIPSLGYEVRTPQGAFVPTPNSEGRSPFGTPQHHRPSLQYAGGRATSSAGIETLSDNASMQQPPMSRHSSYAGPSSMSSVAGRMGIHRTLSNVSSSDLVMAEAPSQTPPPRVVAVPSLSDEEQKTVQELEDYLSKNSYAYESHVQLINLLHQGFVAHVYNAAGESIGDPRDYNLLSDLRQAREAMDSRFAVGEEIWKDWIQDESLLARSGEERMSVMELCQKAVLEEHSSVTLWLLYGEYVMQTFSVANGQAEGDSSQWTEDDKEICKEVFTHEIVLDVWERAVRATQWRIDASNLIWDRYIDWILAEFPENPAPHQVEQVNAMFMARLQVPHATWSETCSKFWPIISKYNADTWEEIMAATNEMAGPAKQQYGLREVYELNVRRASEAGDKVALYAAFSDYLSWEVNNERKKRTARFANFNLEIRSALFERALLHFPTVIDWWLDYADFLIIAHPHSLLLLPVLERATRHCPWSGDLWSRRILRSEVERRPYEEVGNVKHKATNSGLLDIGGMEEVLKVYSAWCIYLRRRAFDPENTDDEVDMAEMGITGTLEDAQVAGRKIYGKDFKGDPLFRLERIHAKFLTEARRFDEARRVYHRLVEAQPHSAEAWLGYYNWELLIWAHERLDDDVRLETTENAPHECTSVLQRALAQRNLDWPEKIIETYINHLRQHERAEAAQRAETEIRAAKYQLQIRRAKEAEEAAVAAAVAAAAEATTTSQPQQTGLDTILEEAPGSGKRKRDDAAFQNGEEAVKRNKTDAVVPVNSEDSASASALIKRDREHNTITIKDLPNDVSERRIRQFFADCGDVLSVNITNDDDAMNAYATVEFGDHEGVLAAKTRDGKEIDGQTIRIQAGTLSTLYVTNYPADYDEAKMRELFQDYGTVTSVRFPSLNYNARRRFCYVQFFTTEEARAATTLNNKAINAEHRLVALISDPTAKKSRSGATAEGREVHVANVDFGATQQEIKDLFSQHGTVENVRMLKSAAGKFTGSCFVIFSKSEEANAALALNNKPLRTRLIRVTLATDKSSAAKQGVTKIIHNSTGSVEPENRTETTGRHGSVASTGSAAAADELNEETAKTKRERTIALLNLPDTVNDARIQSYLTSYGPLRKIIMKRDRNGAMIEFVNLQDAGKVSMGIDCSALGPDVRVGSVAELMASKQVNTGKHINNTGALPKPALPVAMKPAQASVSRPKQAGGRRGGLGFKRGGLGSSTSRSADGGDEKMDEGGSGAKKGNAEFRALFEKSREGAGDQTKDEDA